MPTSRGPAGGIVCEPAAAPRAALLFLQGGGRSGRSGFNSEWARLTRRLAALGTVVLRYDFWHEGDSSMITAERDDLGTDLPSNKARDLALLGEVAAWFRQRTEGLDLIVAGSCYGARLGLELAGGGCAAAATLLLVPYLRRFNEDDRGGWRERMQKVRGEPGTAPERTRPAPLERVDPLVLEAFEAALRNGPSWVLVGERDAPEAVLLGQALGDRGLEVQVEPGAALYPGNEPTIQQLVSDRFAARLSEFLDSTA